MIEEIEEVSEEESLEVDFKQKYLFFKGKMCYGNRNKICGLFSAIIAVSDGGFVKLEVVLSNRDEAYYIEASSKAFERVLSKSSKNEKIQGRTLHSEIKESFNQDFCLELIELISDSNREGFKNLMKEKLEDIVKETIELDLFVEIRDREGVRKVYPQLLTEDEGEDIEADKAEKDLEGNLEDEEYSLVQVLPIIAPVSGKRVGDLKDGDKIIAKVALSYPKEGIDEDSNELDSYNVDDSEVKLLGVIKEVDFDSESRIYKILIDFGEDFIGIMSFEGNPNLKLTVPKDEVVKGELTAFSLIKDNIIFYGFILLLIINIILVIIIIR